MAALCQTPAATAPSACAPDYCPDAGCGTTRHWRGERQVGDVVTMFTHVSWHLSSILARGGPVMVPLLASSVLSLAIIIERGRFWRRFRQCEGGETILALVAAGH